MASKLYVGNLPYSATEDELRDLFGQHGNVVSVAVISDKFSGRSKGYGFVEMSTDEEAQAAVDALNGTDMGGRAIVVNPARPMTERRPGGGGGGFNRGGNGGSRGGYGRDR